MNSAMDRAANQSRKGSTNKPLGQLFNTIRLWQLRARSRRQLAQLDARQLADIGISACDRLEELEKPFWRE